jgi:ribbon-helix-helix CopG family protein
MQSPASSACSTRTSPVRANITFMALSRKKATTIALDPEHDRLLTIAARERGISRSEFIRQHLSLVLEQYRRHPKPRSAGIIHSLPSCGITAQR